MAAFALLCFYAMVSGSTAAVGAAVFGLNPGIVMVSLTIGVVFASQALSTYQWSRRSHSRKMMAEIKRKSDHVINGD